MATETINNLEYYVKENVVFTELSCSNRYEISSSIPIQYYDTSSSQPESLLNLLSNFNTFGISQKDYLNNNINEIYLNTYRQLLDLFVSSGNQSAFFRETILTGSSAGLGRYSGLDIYKNINYFELLDIQQIKEETIDNTVSNPCFLMDVDNQKKLIDPLKLELIKTNFRILCRTIILSCKLQNLFISSVFDNNEFFTSDSYKDSTFIDYCYSVFMQKMESVIPSYKSTVYTFLNEDLKYQLNSGESIKDPISNLEISFETPIGDTNIEPNVEKYIKVLFLNEFLFMTKKCNLFFSQTGFDPGLTGLSQYEFSLAPSSSFGTKLYSAKEYFIESLPVFGINEEDAVFFVESYKESPQYKNYISYNLDDLSSTLRFSIRIEEADYTTINSISGYNITASIRLWSANYATDALNALDAVVCTVSKFYSKRTEASSDSELRNFINNRISDLKREFLLNEEFLFLTNYIFPLNKILNLASITTILMMNKIYENCNTILDGSIATIANIHDIILGNEEKAECETPDSTDQDAARNNIILGINLEIAKAIATFPLSVIKGLEEQFDPNIAIATKIRSAAESLGAPKLPIIPYSLGLLPALTIPPPVGVGPPLIPPWGYIYWGIDAAEIALEYAKNGIQDAPSISFEPISKNPIKPKC